MTQRLYLDVETRSATSLDKCGAMRYARDEWAGINAIGFAADEGPLEQVRREEIDNGGPMLDRFKQQFYTAEKLIAHGAEFEMITIGVLLKLWRPAGCWSCTKAKAGYYGYPRSLDGCAIALNCKHLKDIQGKAAMLWCANPINTPEDGPEIYERMYAYNLCDIPPMREIDRKLPDLPTIVQDNWVADTEINLRGLPVDRKVIANAIWLRAEAGEQANNQMARLTNGFAQTVNQTEKIADWFNTQHGTRAVMEDCQANTVEKLLGYAELTQAQKAVLELRQEAGLTSLAKYERMQGEEVGGRIYQAHDWYGTHTGRPTGNRSQLLNMPRSEGAEHDADLIAQHPWFVLQMPKPMERLKEGIRGAFAAEEGNTLIGCDQSQGEARGTAWVAGDDALMRLFNSGADPYCQYGETIFGHPIDKYLHVDKRQASKASVLAFGFAGGIGAGQRIGVNYKMNFSALSDVIMPQASPKELASGLWCYNYYRESFPPKPLSEREGVAFDVLKQWYRRDFPQVVAYWETLEKAFLNGGEAGPVSVRLLPDKGRAIRLPSGRELFYRDVQVSAGGYSYKSRHKRESLWHGQLMENVVQAISTDVNNFYKALVKEFASIVHHCYDEFTLECREEEAETIMYSLKRVTQEAKPNWAGGYPIAFDYWEGRRYGK